MHGQQVRQLLDTLVTLAIVCWQLACQAVLVYHLISRHCGKMWDLFLSRKDVLYPGLDIEIEMDCYLEPHKGMVP